MRQLRCLILITVSLALFFLITLLHQHRTYYVEARKVRVVKLAAVEKLFQRPISFERPKEANYFEWTPFMQQRIIQLRDRLEELSLINSTRYGPISLNDLKKKSACDFYKNEAFVDRIFIPNVWDDLTTFNKDDITIATQFTVSKINVLSLMVRNYDGPISAAIELKVNEMDTFLELITRFPSIIAKENLDLHITLSNGTLYPVNFMRNIALNNTKTDYVFLNDLDFIPSYGLHSFAKNIVLERNNSKEVYVIPAMEFTSDAGLEYPQNLTELLYFWDRGIIVSSEQIHWMYGHRKTNYNKWKEAKEPFRIEYEDGFEPYIISRTSDIPRYNTSFFAGYRDKMSHLTTVNASGFSFVVIPEHFVLHYPHVKKTSTLFHKCGLELYDQLRKQLLGPNVAYTPNTHPKVVRRVIRKRVIRKRKVDPSAIKKTAKR